MIRFIGPFDTARDYTLQFTITQTSVLSHGLHSRCLVAASNGGRSPFSGFPNYPRPQLPASNSNSSQRLNFGSSLTHSLRPCHSSGGYSLASHRGGPGLSPGQVRLDFCWAKWHWGRFSPRTSVSPATLHSTNCSTLTIIYHRGVV
jgi:hypothetical protein